MIVQATVVLRGASARSVANREYPLHDVRSGTAPSPPPHLEAQRLKVLVWGWIGEGGGEGRRLFWIRLEVMNVSVTNARLVEWLRCYPQLVSAILRSGTKLLVGLTHFYRHFCLNSDFTFPYKSTVNTEYILYVSLYKCLNIYMQPYIHTYTLTNTLTDSREYIFKMFAWDSKSFSFWFP